VFLQCLCRIHCQHRNENEAIPATLKTREPAEERRSLVVVHIMKIAVIVSIDRIEAEPALFVLPRFIRSKIIRKGQQITAYCEPANRVARGDGFERNAEERRYSESARRRFKKSGRARREFQLRRAGHRVSMQARPSYVSAHRMVPHRPPWPRFNTGKIRRRN